MYRTHYSTELTEKNFDEQVQVAGWIQDIRNIGSIAFVILRDRKGTLQVTVLKKQMPDLFKQLTSLTRESVVSVTGLCQKNEKVRNGYEILPEKIDILSEAASPLPLGIVDKVDADFDTRFDNRCLDLRKSSTQAIFKIRNTVLSSIHEYLRKQGFLEVHTPNIIASSSEGGTEMFSLQYFEKKAFLAQSPQLYKQSLMSTGLDRVYEIAWYFRAEEHNTRRHLNESTAVDVEMSFIQSEEEIMKVLEGLVQHMWKAAKTCTDELSLLNKTLTVPTLPFLRVAYDDAIAMLQDAGSSISWGEDLGTEDERLLGNLLKKEKNAEFYFIVRYPLQSKPFYTMPEAEKYSRSFDLEVKGVELASGSQRIHDVDLLKTRLKACGLHPKDFTTYLDAFRYGMPPHGGFGFGIERFFMELLDIENIRECILFPRDRTRLTP